MNKPRQTMTLRTKLEVWFWVLRTRIMFSPFFNEAFGLILFCTGLFCLYISKLRAAAFLTRAHRNISRVARQKLVEQVLKRHHLLHTNIIDQLVLARATDEQLHAGRVFILKEKNGLERGVIIMKYNDTFTKLRQECDMDKLLADYFIVLELSYYGCCNPQILQFMTYENTYVVVGAVQPLERGFLKRLDSNIIVSNFSSSTWVNDKVFLPLNLPKIYDCIMVAMWNDIKRHYLLFEAIKKINDPDYRCCLIGFPFGRSIEDYEKMIDYYGIGQNIVLFDRVKQSKVNELLNCSKVNLLLSSKEGGNKSIVEGFFAGVPGIILKDHIGVNLDWINDKTGRLTDPSGLSDTLKFFRTNYDQFDPRHWAMNNISCHTSTAALEETLKGISNKLGLPWTQSLAVKVNQPECSYYETNTKIPSLDFDKYRRQ